LQEPGPFARTCARRDQIVIEHGDRADLNLAHPRDEAEQVDLPTPSGPTSATAPPRGKSNAMPSSAATAP
jgi:hypothetical protein